MTDLEAEIDVLRELDAQRVESGKLRDEGIGVLTTILNKDYKGEPLVEFPRLSMALWELSSDPPKNKLEEWMKQLEGLELKTIVTSRMPILLAAGVVQALAAAPGFTFTKSLHYCYYLIVWELYTADAPDWAVGGARANPKGSQVSAYVTRECVQALLSLARVLESTTNFIAKIRVIHKRVDQLNQLKRMQTSFSHLQKWALMEEARLKVFLHTTIRHFSCRLVFQPSKPPDDPRSINIEDSITEIASQLTETAGNAKLNFENALEGINTFREEEEFYSRRDEAKRSRYEREEAGHLIAVSAITKGQTNTVEFLKLFASPGWYKELETWKKFNKVSARFIMDRQRIFIANLAKGAIGDDTANLLGALLISQFQQAAMSRVDQPEEARVDFHLVVDEFQSFATDSFETILSEARKYRLSLTLAHQYIEQLSEPVRRAVFGNVGTIISFRVGERDAQVLAREFGNTYRAEHFSGLSNHEICVKLLHHGEEREPFTGTTFPPQWIRHGRAEKIIARSRERYATPRRIVEEKIRRWMQPAMQGAGTFKRPRARNGLRRRKG